MVESISRIHIPEVTIPYSAADRQQWIDAYDPWIKSGEKDYSVQHEGWTCWGGVLFFREKRASPKGKGNTLDWILSKIQNVTC